MRPRLKRVDPYGKAFAKYYDTIYSDKDYDKECEYIESLFHKFSRKKVRTILDISCGTGGHAIPLSKRGYHVVAIDQSEQMVRLAIEKARKEDDIEFSVGDMRRLALGQRFDACISLFDSICALGSYLELDRTLGNIARHLRRDGIFIVQFWNAAAVLTLKPRFRRKTRERDGIRVIRETIPRLNSQEEFCEVTYEITAMEGGAILDQLSTSLNIRYFSPLLMSYLLTQNGFETCSVTPFMKSGKVSENDWSVLIVARKTS